MQFTNTILIQKPVKDVWCFFIDTSNLKQWVANFIQYEPIQGAFQEQGTTGRYIYQNKGKYYALQVKVLSCIANKEFSELVSHPAMQTKHSIKFMSKENSTEIEFTATYTFKGSGPKLFSFLLKSAFKKRQYKDLQKLKSILER